MEVPLSPVEKILKRAGMRVSDEAVTEFANLLEEVIADIAAEAVANAKSAGRKTVSGEDVRIAKRRIT